MTSTANLRQDHNHVRIDYPSDIDRPRNGDSARGVYHSHPGGREAHSHGPASWGYTTGDILPARDGDWYRDAGVPSSPPPAPEGDTARDGRIILDPVDPDHRLNRRTFSVTADCGHTYRVYQGSSSTTAEMVANVVSTRWCPPCIRHELARLLGGDYRPLFGSIPKPRLSRERRREITYFVNRQN